MADAGTAPIHQLPAAGPGHTDTAACQGRKCHGGQHPGCRAGELARGLARPARPAPLRGGLLAGPRRAPDLPPRHLRPVRLLRVHPVRGHLAACAGGARDVAAGGLFRRADAGRPAQARPTARRAATRTSIRVRVPAVPVSRPLPDGGNQRRADRRPLRMDHRRGDGTSGRSRAAHGGRHHDQIPPRAARLAIPGRPTGALALRADARRLARRDARLAAHLLRPRGVPRLNVRLPADTTRRRGAVQHLDLPAAPGDRGQAGTRRRAGAARAVTRGASSRAGREAARRPRRRTPHRRAATPGLLVLQLPHLVLSAAHHRDHPSPT